MKSHARCTATKVTLPSGEEFLFVEIAIDCPQCGQYSTTFGGHHLRMIRDALIEMIDLHPGLTGKDDDVQVLTRLKVEGQAPPDPTRN